MNGIVQGTTVTYAGVLGMNAAPIRIGASSSGDTYRMDEIRFSKGLARYAITGFTPPAYPFGELCPPPPSADFSFTAGFAGSDAFPPVMIADAKGLKPRIWMPHENTTVNT